MQHEPKTKKVFEATLESEVNMVNSLLNENGILTEIKSEGMGSYLQIYSGVNYQGTEIYVLEEDYDKAQELIDECWSKPMEVSLEEAFLASDSIEDADMDEQLERLFGDADKAEYQAYKDRQDRIKRILRYILIIGGAIIFLVPVVLSFLRL